ncbi:MAG: hypothetical protein LRY73_12220 [Bacillus sp. (in: Bacteria)]|nr:hypothetical protein [Bacillus sp. (in: firmicutes)]
MLKFFKSILYGEKAPQKKEWTVEDLEALILEWYDQAFVDDVFKPVKDIAEKHGLDAAKEWLLEAYRNHEIPSVYQDEAFMLFLYSKHKVCIHEQLEAIGIENDDFSGYEWDDVYLRSFHEVEAKRAYVAVFDVLNAGLGNI